MKKIIFLVILNVIELIILVFAILLAIAASNVLR